MLIPSLIPFTFHILFIFLSNIQQTPKQPKIYHRELQAYDAVLVPSGITFFLWSGSDKQVFTPKWPAGRYIFLYSLDLNIQSTYDRACVQTT